MGLPGLVPERFYLLGLGLPVTEYSEYHSVGESLLLKVYGKWELLSLLLGLFRCYFKTGDGGSVQRLCL